MPYEFWKWKMVEEWHWTPEQVDNLSLGDFHEYQQFLEAQGKIQTSNLK